MTLVTHSQLLWRDLTKDEVVPMFRSGRSPTLLLLLLLLLLHLHLHFLLILLFLLLLLLGRQNRRLLNRRIPADATSFVNTASSALPDRDS